MYKRISIGPESMCKEGTTDYGYVKDPEVLFSEGYLYKDSAQYIATCPIAAKYFLAVIFSDEVDLFHNMLALQSLIDMQRPIAQSYKGFAELKPAYEHTLLQIRDQAQTLFSIDKFNVDNDAQAIQQNASFGDYAIMLDAVSRARQSALVGYIEQMVDHLLKWSDINDLNGECYLKVSDLRHPPLAKHFSEISYPHSNEILAHFKPYGADTYKLELNELGPYSNNHIYKQAAYQSAEEVLSFCLQANVKMHSWLED